MSKKVIVVPSFSTKPGVKQKGKMTKSEAERRIIQKHESKASKNPRALNKRRLKNRFL